ncbi:MAG: hypothetical protein Q8N23_12420 [Archangium sp.]|nr:hypothetical protein [Archangium sp.]MDP3574710.1 hypothetical protein [Archangium sp.]
MSELAATDHLGTGSDHQWRERRRILLETGRVDSSLQVLIDDAHANRRSLATFKPSQMIDLIIEEEDEREWNPDRVRQMRELSRQAELFNDDTWRNTFALIRKLPYRFSYRFRDDSGRESTLIILDWEIGALFWNCLRSEETEERAITKVREMYVSRFFQTDIHLLLGTTQAWHQVGPNPWVVIGVFPAPHIAQLDLL